MRPYISQDLCSNCGECVTTCPYEVFSIDGKDMIVVTAPQDCIECGACMDSCPCRAIYMDD